MQPLDLWTRSFPGVQRVGIIDNIVGQLGQGGDRLRKQYAEGAVKKLRFSQPLGK